MLVREAAEPIDDIETASVDALIERIGDARLVLLGAVRPLEEASRPRSNELPDTYPFGL